MITVGTHSGVFHADEVFAIATLKMLGEISVIRSRNPLELENADFLVDVGMVYDPKMGYYDHHQKGGAGTRWDTNEGVPYSSFGLIWQHYGVDACSGNPVVADMVDEELVAAVDAADCGHKVCSGLNFSVSAIIRGLNPTWCEKNRDSDKAFWEAVDLAEKILRRKIASCTAREAARSQVRKAITAAGDDPVVVLGKFCPWQEVVCAEAPSAKFVVFQDGSGEWRAQCVPTKLGEFDQRLPFPENWGGLKADELAYTTGVEDAVFCHIGLFICGAESKEGAIALAEKALVYMF